MNINKIYYRKFGSGLKQPFKIIKFVRGSTTKAYIEVYEKSHKQWKQKTQAFELSEIIANN